MGHPGDKELRRKILESNDEPAIGNVRHNIPLDPYASFTLPKTLHFEMGILGNLIKRNFRMSEILIYTKVLYRFSWELLQQRVIPPYTFDWLSKATMASTTFQPPPKQWKFRSLAPTVTGNGECKLGNLIIAAARIEMNTPPQRYTIEPATGKGAENYPPVLQLPNTNFRPKSISQGSRMTSDTKGRRAIDNCHLDRKCAGERTERRGSQLATGRLDALVECTNLVEIEEKARRGDYGSKLSAESLRKRRRQHDSLGGKASLSGLLAPPKKSPHHHKIKRKKRRKVELLLSPPPSTSLFCLSPFTM
ncbi:hypothetical protein AAMO2058_001585200 [Amorphochlora amoebiformis]